MVSVRKRKGEMVDFDKSKISIAILQAMEHGSGILSSKIAKEIAEEIYEKYKTNDEVSIYDIEGDVFNLLIEKGQNLTAKAYESYRSIRQFQREHNTIVEQTKEMVSGQNEYWNTENSNKNAKEIKTQRDYMAGIVSTDITKRFLLSPDIVQAHDAGILHFHDADYFAENAITNCCLINLEDMLQNGTVMNNKMIEKPHRLITATTIATQIITAVSSSQYGGTTITLTHLAPFVRDSENRIREELKEEIITLVDEKRMINEVEFEKHIKSSLIGGVIGAAAFGAAGAVIGSRPKEKEKRKSIE